MNDQELDAILDTWKAPEPSPALREAVCQAVPRRPPTRPYRWLGAAAGIVLTAALLGIAALGSGHAQLADGAHSGSFFEGFAQTIHERHLRFAIWLQSIFAGEPRHRAPQLYIDGKPSTAPESFGEGQGVHFYLPAQGVYVLTMGPPADPSIRSAGTVKGSTVQFRFEGKDYRIAAGKSLISGDERPVYVLHYDDFHRLHH